MFLLLFKFVHLFVFVVFLVVTPLVSPPSVAVQTVFPCVLKVLIKISSFSASSSYDVMITAKCYLCRCG